MDEAIAIQPGAETAGNARRVKAEFEMFFLRCWVLVSAFLTLRRGMSWQRTGLALLFSLLALFGGGERGGFSRIRVAAHPFVVPAVE